MPKGKGTYGSKKGRPPMEYGQVKKPKMTDLSGDGKVTKKDVMIGRDVPGFEKGMDKKAMMYGKKPKAYKPMKHKGPYMMKPGSKEVNSPSSFKSNEPAMMFKNSMPKDHREGHPKPDIDVDLIQEAKREFKVRPPKTQGDSIYLTKIMKKMGGDEGLSKARLDLYKSKKEGMLSRKESLQANKEKIAKRKKEILAKRSKPKMYGSKPKMYGSKPKMYGKKK